MGGDQVYYPRLGAVAPAVKENIGCPQEASGQPPDFFRYLGQAPIGVDSQPLLNVYSDFLGQGQFLLLQAQVIGDFQHQNIRGQVQGLQPDL